MAKSCSVPQFIYIHSQEGNIPEFDIAVSRFKEVLKTEGEARGFQHFPADIKSVTSLLVPFLKQYQFSNKNQFKLDYERGVCRDIAFRRFREVLKTEGEARGFQHCLQTLTV